MLKEIKYSGYSTTPSDYEAPDGELATAVNVIPENAALHPVLPPKTVLQVPQGWVLLFVHDTFQFTHYIIHCIDQQSNDYGKLRYIDADAEPIVIDMEDEDFEIKDFQDATLKKLDAIGNTLLAITDSEMYYILWKKGVYQNLGNHLPELDLKFSLEKTLQEYETDKNTIDISEMQPATMADFLENATDEQKTQLKQYVMAAANKATALALEDYKFVFPFFVRYAYRLFDGSHTMHSAPILMLTHSSIPLLSPWDNTNTPKIKVEGIKMSVLSVETLVSIEVSGKAYGFTLRYKAINQQQLETLEQWSDIIDGVDVFVSQQFYPYDQGAQEKKVELNTTTDDTLLLATLPAKYIEKEIELNHSFFFIKKLELRNLAVEDTSIVADFYPSNENLVVRESLPDDYDSHDLLIPGNCYSFNSRVNLYELKKQLFDGFAPACIFSSPEYTTQQMTKFVVVIEDEQDIVVQSAQMNVDLMAGNLPWFYYPNIKAKWLYAFIGNTVKKYRLTTHDNLMGAFYLDTVSDEPTTPETTPEISTDEQKTINLQNKVYTSEVNNPYYFPPLGVNTTSTGRIYGLCAAVSALSQGQFGQFPMYAFTSEGVWAMEVTSTGTYSAKQPVTRDVCINPASITSLDTSVLFATDRGIMMLSGSNSLCITDALNDEQSNYDITRLITAANITTLTSLTSDAVTYIPFKQYIKNCRIIYDYTHQRIIVYNPNTSVNYAYMFSLESKKWGMIVTDIKDNINSYPEAIAINADNQAVNMSVYEEGTQQAPTVVNALVMTRPLKLDAPDTLKTINTVIQRGMFRKGHVKTALYGSRDLYNWHLVSSSVDHYLRGFSGTPYKYFRVALFCALEPDESIYGCTIQHNPRLTNKPR